MKTIKPFFYGALFLSALCLGACNNHPNDSATDTNTNQTGTTAGDGGINDRSSTGPDRPSSTMDSSGNSNNGTNDGSTTTSGTGSTGTTGSTGNQ